MTEKKPITTGSVSRLFIAFKNKYGVEWNDQWDSEDDHRLGLNQWYEELKHFSYDEVKKAFDYWTRAQRTPPSVQQFVLACKGKRQKTVIPKYELFETPDFGERASDETHTNAMSRIKDMVR